MVAVPIFKSPAGGKPPINAIADMAEFLDRGQSSLPIFLSNLEELFDIQVDFLAA